MAFNDGDPIDAAKLGDLETSLAQLKSQIPQFGSSTGSVVIDNKTIVNAVVPRIYGGKVSGQKLTPGTTATFTVNFPNGTFQNPPNSITITPIRGGGSYTYDWYILSSSVTASGFAINAFQPTGTTAITLGFYYLAVQHA